MEEKQGPVGIIDGDITQLTEPPPKPKRHLGKFVGIATAVIVLIAVVTASAVIFAGGRNPDKLLAEGWGNTNQMLEERYSGGPFSAIGAVMDQETDSTKVSLTLSNIEAAGTELPGTLRLNLYTDKEKQVALEVDSTLMELALDAQIYYSKEFLGLGSKALLGDVTAYGATPGHFAEEAKGGIFDPDTGSFPIYADTLKELDDTFSGKSAEPAVDAESMAATIDEIVAQYQAFVQSIKPEMSKGTLPNTEMPATVLTYVYPADKAVDMLGTMMDTYLSSEWVDSYYGSANTMGDIMIGNSANFDLDEFRTVWDEALADLKEYYTGDVTVRYYLADKTVAYLEISAEPAYNGDKVQLDAFVDFGLNGDTLTAKLSLGEDADIYQLSFTSTQTVSDEHAASNWELRSNGNGVTAFSVISNCTWDKTSNALKFSLIVPDKSKMYRRIDAEGTLTIDAPDSFELALKRVSVSDYTGLSGRFGLNLALEHGITVPQPQNTRNFFTLSEDEVERILDTVAIILMSGNPSSMDPGAEADPAPGWAADEFTLDGITLTVPFAYKTLEDMGWTMKFSKYDNMNVAHVLNPGDFTSGIVELSNSKYDEDFIFWVGFQNNSGEIQTIKDCDVWSLKLERVDGAELVENIPSASIVGGLSWGSNIEEVKAILGEPADVYRSHALGSDTLTYQTDDYSKYLELIIYDDFGLGSIDMEDYK